MPKPVVDPYNLNLLQPAPASGGNIADRFAAEAAAPIIDPYNQNRLQPTAARKEPPRERPAVVDPYNLNRLQPQDVQQLAPDLQIRRKEIQRQIAQLQAEYAKLEPPADRGPLGNKVDGMIKSMRGGKKK